MRRLALPLLTTIALAALTACGGGATPTPAASSAPLPSVAAASAPAESAPAESAPAASTAAGSAAACAVAPAGGAATVNATIKNFQFSPQPIQAKVGDVVAWKNDDSTAHTVTMDAGTCGSDNIGAGASAMLVFTAPGTYAYHCKIHPAMTGFTVEVK
jgi:plastocyanin